MGILAQTLKPSSSHRAKKEGVWEALMDRLTDCMVAEDVDEFERHVIGLGLAIPAAWEEPLAEVVLKRRGEIDDENPMTIIRDRFDF